jgi:hypothetical protein
MHMADWVAKLDDFIRLSDRDILAHAGRISHQEAEEHAHAQYQHYEQRRRELAKTETSDFDQAVRRLTEQAPDVKPQRRKKNGGEQQEDDQ